MFAQVLKDLNIVEYSHFVSGPYCGKLLADMGANVIKIEAPGIGEEARRRGPYPDDVPNPEKSGLFQYLNSNKLGITLDLEREDGNRIFGELISKADMFIENNSPQLISKLEISFQHLQKINPRLIMASITPFGQTGRYKDFKAYYTNIFHAGGEGFLLPDG